MPSGEFREVSEAEAREHWDSWLSRFRDRSVSQSLAWADYKRGPWRPRFFALFSGAMPRVMALALERGLPGLPRLVWVSGGPVYGLGGRTADHSALREFLAGLTAVYASRAVVRLRPLVPWSEEVVGVLEAAGFSPAARLLAGGLTSVLDLSAPVDRLRAGLDRKWRNQLKKSESYGPRVEFSNGGHLLARLQPLHEGACRRKGLTIERLSLAQLRSAERAFGKALMVAIASIDGRDGSGMALWNFAGRATLWIGAADEWGLSKNLPKALYWATVLRLKSDGAASFDLAGLNPEVYPGVTHFKLSLGGETLKTVGEWDWSRAPATRRLFNLTLGALRALT